MVAGRAAESAAPVSGLAAAVRPWPILFAFNNDAEESTDMLKFMYIFRGGGYATPGLLSPTELQQHLARWTAWTDGLLRAGKMVGGHPLAYPGTGKTVRTRERVVTDGPYAESKDLVTGILLVEAASLEEAAELARGCPILEHDGTVEVRPVMATPEK
jgi:hypothetical protein